MDKTKKSLGKGQIDNNEVDIVIAVAGNPNTGKSTLINSIAGSRLSVGNWPGVTVEKKSANFEFRKRRIMLVDLPGIYSLSPYTQEEIIARDFLVTQKPDVIINVVDATNLERNLYLTLQLLELGIPLVMALNMYDEANEKGFLIDTDKIASILSCKVVSTVASRGDGLDELMEVSITAAENSSDLQINPVFYGEDIEKAIGIVLNEIKFNANINATRWMALKVLEGDELAAKVISVDLESLSLEKATRHLKHAHGENIASLLGEIRYGLAAGLVREVLQKPEKRKRELTERIDAVVLNRYLGIPVFLLIMWVMFKLTFDIAGPFTDWFDSVTSGPVKRWTASLMQMLATPSWTISLATEGIIAGVGFVLSFVPPIFTMMFFITLLEGSGYMARAAFVMDRLMHSIGLHGKSFIPLLLGFGCNVPAVYATRTLENPRDKVLTALLIPLMSCGARLPVYVVFVSAFFSSKAGTILWSLYLLGIVLAVGMGFLFKKTIFRGAVPVFIMELPPYRMPSVKNLLIHTWEKGKHFLIKAGTYILVVSVLVWFALHLPWGVESKKDSYLGYAGKSIAPVFTPLGFGTWEASASLITGLIAKEIVVSTMAEIYVPKNTENGENKTFHIEHELKEIFKTLAYAATEAIKNVFATMSISTINSGAEEKQERLKAQIVQVFTPLSAYSFMVFVLLYMPCVVVLIAMRQEFGTWKWAGFTIAYQTALAWTASFFIFQSGRLLGF